MEERSPSLSLSTVSRGWQRRLRRSDLARTNMLVRRNHRRRQRHRDRERNRPIEKKKEALETLTTLSSALLELLLGKISLEMDSSSVLTARASPRPSVTQTNSANVVLDGTGEQFAHPQLLPVLFRLLLGSGKTMKNLSFFFFWTFHELFCVSLSLFVSMSVSSLSLLFLCQLNMCLYVSLRYINFEFFIRFLATSESPSGSDGAAE